MAKTTKKQGKTKVTNVGLYWPHVIFALFGAFVIMAGAGMISNDIQNLASFENYESSDWQKGIGVIIFGAMLIGAALSKASLAYHKNKKASQ